MADIASIFLRVDTGELQRGNNELDTFQQKATGAAGAADGFNASGKETAKVSKEIAQEVAETHKRVEEYNRRLRETQTTVSASSRVQDQLTESYFRQIDRVKKLGTGTQELNAIQAQIRTARAAGNITQNDYLTLVSHASEKMRELTKAEEVSAAAKSIFIQKLKDQVATQRLSREELLRYRAAQLGVSSSADVYIRKMVAAKNETHAFSLQSAAARRELGVMFGELARGNLGALRSSSITLANRSGLLEQLMTLRGLGIVGSVGGIAGAVYGLGKAWYQGSQEAVEFNRQLILTGNYAGKTTTQLQDMAKAISGNGVTQHSAAGVLAQVVGSGSFKSNQLEVVAKAAAAMEYATGQSVDATIKNFQTLYDSPTKASEELNKQLHYLTSSQYEYISSLEKRGYKEAAAEAAANAYSAAEQKRSKQLIDNLSGIDRLLKNVTDSWKEFWDSALNVGRAQSAASRLHTMEATLAEMQANDKDGVLGRLKNNAMLVDRQQLENDIRLLRTAVTLEGDIVTVRSKGKEADDARTKSIQYQNETLSKNLSWQQKRSTALTELWQMVAKAPEVWTEGKRKIAVAQINADNKPPVIKKGAQYHTYAGDKAEDSAQADLLALQAQLEVLRQHTGLNDKISQQRRDLWKSQAQFTVLEQAAGKRQLSAQEKSLLASKDAVLSSKERLAVIGDEIAQQERLNKLQDSSTKYITQMAGKRAAIRDSAGLSSRDSQRRLEEAQLRQGWQNQGGDLNDKGYQNQLKALKDFYAEEDRLRGEWLLGTRKGWSEYLDSATNVYSSMSNIASTTLSGMSDMLTSLTTTGTASFRNFTTSILKMIVEVINKLLVAYAVQSAMGWMGVSAGGGLGSITKIFGFDDGGYTGSGGKYEPAGIVHKDEFVFTKEATRNIGVDNLYALMRSAQGYANGGLVGSTVTGTAPMYGLRGGGVTVDMSGMTIVTKGSQQQPQNAGNNELVSKAIRNEVIAIVTERIDKAMGQSGSINNFIDAKIGRR